MTNEIRLDIRITKEDKKLIVKEAKKAGISQSELIKLTLRLYASEVTKRLTSKSTE